MAQAATTSAAMSRPQPKTSTTVANRPLSSHRRLHRIENDPPSRPAGRGAARGATCFCRHRRCRPQECPLTGAPGPAHRGATAKQFAFRIRVEIAWRACRFAALSGSLLGRRPATCLCRRVYCIELDDDSTEKGVGSIMHRPSFGHRGRHGDGGLLAVAASPLGAGVAEISYSPFVHRHPSCVAATCRPLISFRSLAAISLPPCPAPPLPPPSAANAGTESLLE